MAASTFSSLPVGSRFRFESESKFPFSGMARGPWIKTGARTYVHADDPKGSKYRVGSARAKVERENPGRFPKYWYTKAGFLKKRYRSQARRFNPVKGRKVKGGRAVSLRNFTGTVVQKKDGSVNILGKGRRR